MAGDNELKKAARKASEEAKRTPRKNIDPNSVRYDNASGDDVKSLWAECGAEKVKALGPARFKMTLGQVREACK